MNMFVGKLYKLKLSHFTGVLWRENNVITKVVQTKSTTLYGCTFWRKRRNCKSRTN